MNRIGFYCDQDKNIKIQELLSEISNTFTYEFRVKPSPIISIPFQTNFGFSGKEGPHQWGVGADHGGMDGKKGGTIKHCIITFSSDFWI